MDRARQPAAYPAGQLLICWCVYHVLTNTLFTSQGRPLDSALSLSCSDCISGLNLPQIFVWSTSSGVRPPLPPSALLLILLSASRYRVQLWPSQGAFAGSHLTGPWPQDDSQHQHVSYMRDKATQVSAVGGLYLCVWWCFSGWCISLSFVFKNGHWEGKNPKCLIDFLYLNNL